MAPGEEDRRRNRDGSEGGRRPFNPMTTYFYVALAILVSYSVFYVLGWEALIIVMSFFLVSVLKETSFILKYITSGFAKKAAYFNLLLALVFFTILVMNSYWIIQFDVPLILPQIEQLTLACPLFVLTSVFGSRNIRLMFGPV